MPYLEHTTGDGTVVRYRLASHRTVVGRGTECDVSLSGPLVSRRHCEITLEDGVYYVRDLGSRIGTWVNGRLVEYQALSDGDRIGVVPHMLTYMADPAGDDTLAAVDEETTVRVDPEEVGKRLADLLSRISKTGRRQPNGRAGERAG